MTIEALHTGWPLHWRQSHHRRDRAMADHGVLRITASTDAKDRRTRVTVQHAGGHLLTVSGSSPTAATRAARWRLRKLADAASAAAHTTKDNR